MQIILERDYYYKPTYKKFMKKLQFLLFIGLLINACFTTAQTYLTPPPVSLESAYIEIVDINKGDDSFKFKVIVENISSDKYLVYSIKKTALDLPGSGKVYVNEREKLLIIKPGTKKSIVLSATVGKQGVYPKLDFVLEGLFEASIPSEGVSSEITTVTSEETPTADFGTTKLSVEKALQKKGAFTVQARIDLQGSIKAPKELLLVNHADLKPKASGSELAVDNKKEFTVYPGGKGRFKFKLETEASSVDCNFGEAIKLLKLNPVTVDPIAVNDGSKTYNTCDSYTAETEGSIKINISSDVGCFTFNELGKSLTPQETSNLTYYMSPSSKKVKITMDNGMVIEKAIYAKADYKALYYRIKEKDDKYVLRYMPGASELADPTAKPTEEEAEPTGEKYDVKFCDPVKANTSGTTLIKINSEVGCFDFYLMGEKLTSAMTSNLSFRLNSSSKKVRVVMDNGISFEKSIMFSEGYATLYYTVELKDGKYKLKANHMAAEKAVPENN